MTVFLRSLSLLMLLFLSASSSLAADKPILKIAGWDVYGDPDNSSKVIGYQRIEKALGITIEFTPLSNLDDIVATAESTEVYDAETFDIFIISNEGIEILYDMGLVRPLDLKLLPNYQNMHHNLKFSSWSQFDSKVYAVPWAWGPTGMMYDKDVVTNTDSWNTLWDPAYRGKVAMWDDVSMIWTAALALGYQNVYNLTRQQLQEVRKKLIAFNAQQPVYYKGGGDELALAREGRLLAFNSWYDPSARLKKDGKNFAMTIPREGAVGMFDSYMISQNSQQTGLAHQVINQLISPPIQQEMVRITGLAPANIETLTLLTPAEIKALHLDDSDYFNRMLLWDHMPRKNLYEKVLQAVRQDWQARQKSQ